MSTSHFAFIAAAYGMSFLALGGLGAWVFWDARQTRRKLDALEAATGRRRAERGR